MIVGDRSGERDSAFSAALDRAGRLGRDLIERNPRLAGERDLRALVERLAPGTAPVMLAQLQRAALGPEPARDDIAILMIAITDEARS